MALAMIVSVVAAESKKKVPHHGAYLDPKHYLGPHSFAGMRFIAENPSHVLKMVGTDDGSKWWTLLGKCGGKPMSHITFDFTSKGGPADVTGEALVNESGVAQIRWPDGNTWTLVDAPSSLPHHSSSHLR